MPKKKPKAGMLYTVLKRPQIDGLAKLIRNGHPLRFACGSVGIAIGTYYVWIKQARALAEKPRTEPPLTAAEKTLIELLRAVEKAQADFVKRAVAGIKRHAIKEWTAAAWLLERMYPQEFGRKARIDIGTAEENSEVRTPAEIAAAMDDSIGDPLDPAERGAAAAGVAAQAQVDAAASVPSYFPVDPTA